MPIAWRLISIVIFKSCCIQLILHLLYTAIYCSTTIKKWIFIMLFRNCLLLCLHQNHHSRLLIKTLYNKIFHHYNGMRMLWAEHTSDSISHSLELFCLLNGMSLLSLQRIYYTITYIIGLILLIYIHFLQSVASLERHFNRLAVTQRSSTLLVLSQIDMLWESGKELWMSVRKNYLHCYMQ